MNNTRISQLIKPEILQLSSYHVPNSDNLIKLDAMENPYLLPTEINQAFIDMISQGLAVNRYPDPHAQGLKQQLFQAFDIDSSQFDLLLGNGSDELLQLLIMAVAKPNATIMSIEPSFVMYKMISQFVGTNYVGIPLNNDFSLNIEACLNAIEEHQPAVIFLAYPNNPTGNLFDQKDIEKILQKTNGLVVIDEAYQAFAKSSYLPLLSQYQDKMVIIRTLSKLGLAGLRLGYLIGSPEWVNELDKIRLPYNINVLTQLLAEIALKHMPIYNQQAELLINQRSLLFKALQEIKQIQAFESSANFILIRLDQSISATEVFTKLRDEHRILIKNLSTGHPLLANCLRITVGSTEENTLFLTALQKILAE